MRWMWGGAGEVDVGGMWGAGRGAGAFRRRKVREKGVVEKGCARASGGGAARGKGDAGQFGS